MTYAIGWARRPSWWKRRVLWPLRARLSLFAVSGGAMTDGQWTLGIRIRWWAWPFLVLSAARGLQVRPRAAWPVAIGVLLFIGLRQGLRSLRGA